MSGSKGKVRFIDEPPVIHEDGDLFRLTSMGREYVCKPEILLAYGQEALDAYERWRQRKLATVTPIRVVGEAV